MHAIKGYDFYPTPQEPEYGLLFCLDDNGDRWTLRGDPALVQMMLALSHEHRADLHPGGTWEQRPGWPDEWTSE